MYFAAIFPMACCMHSRRRMRRTFILAALLIACAESVEDVEGYNAPTTKKDSGTVDTTPGGSTFDTGPAPAPPPPAAEDAAPPPPDTAPVEDTAPPAFPDFDSGGDPGPPPPPSDGGFPDPGSDPCGCYDFCSFDCAFEWDPDKCEAECMAWCTSTCGKP
jgi:hypothetical protein